MIERLQLQSVLDQTIETLSKGFRRRVGLAQAIMHDPPVLILDEPTDGLDPNQKHEVRALINDMARDKTIVISTHILEEVDAVCTPRHHHRARPHRGGRHARQHLAARSRYHNAVSMKLEEPAQLAAAREAVAALPAVAAGRSERARCAPHGPAARRRHRSCRALADLAVRAGIKLKELHLESGRLDEVFRTITA